jgi:hypothetical protein
MADETDAAFCRRSFHRLATALAEQLALRLDGHPHFPVWSFETRVQTTGQGLPRFEIRVVVVKNKPYAISRELSPAVFVEEASFKPEPLACALAALLVSDLLEAACAKPTAH